MALSFPGGCKGQFRPKPDGCCPGWTSQGAVWFGAAQRPDREPRSTQCSPTALLGGLAVHGPPWASVSPPITRKDSDTDTALRPLQGARQPHPLLPLLSSLGSSGQQLISVCRKDHRSKCTLQTPAKSEGSWKTKGMATIGYIVLRGQLCPWG